jgi:hypothetical protein
MSRPTIRVPSEETRFVTSDGKAHECYEEAGRHQAFLDFRDWLAENLSDGNFIEAPASDVAKFVHDHWVLTPREEES